MFLMDSPALQTTLPPPHVSPPPAFPTSLPDNSNSPLNALAVPFNPGLVSNKRKTTKNKNVNPDQAKIDYLNLELDASKTRIVQLETTVEDRDITIRILNDKIKLLEQNQQNFINSKYKNPDPYLNNPSSCPSSYSHVSGSCSPHYCHGTRPQYHHCPHPAQHHSTPEPANSTSSGHLEILSEIKT